MSAAGILPAHNVGSGLEGAFILILGIRGYTARRLGPPFLQGPLAWAPNITRSHVIENGEDLCPRPVLHHEIQLLQAPRRPCVVGGEDHQAHRHLLYSIINGMSQLLGFWDFNLRVQDQRNTDIEQSKDFIFGSKSKAWKTKVALNVVHYFPAQSCWS